MSDFQPGSSFARDARRPATGGFWEWLKRLLGFLPPEPTTRRNRTRPRPGSPPGPPDPSGDRKAEAGPPAARTNEKAPAIGSGIEAYARFVGLEVKLGPAELPTEAVVPEDVCAQVLAHIREHKPGPNSFPTLSTRILNLLSRPNEVDISELVRLVMQDPALSVTVLRAANSAAMRGLSEIQSVRDAITRMGLRTVTELAGAMASRSLFSPEARAEYSFRRERWVDLFIDASVVGMGAARLSMQTDRGRSDRAFLGGMLHDVGKTIILKSLAQLQNDGKGDFALSDPQIDALLESLHVTVGSEVHRHWQLPGYLTTVCELHHAPTVPDEPDRAEVHLVRVASGLRRIVSGLPCDPALIAQVDDSLRVLGLNALQFRVYHNEMKEISERMIHIVGG